MFGFNRLLFRFFQDTFEGKLDKWVVEGCKWDEKKLYVVTILQAGHVKSSEAGSFLPGVSPESASRSVSLSRAGASARLVPAQSWQARPSQALIFTSSLHEGQAGEE